jgi:rare lipoprotein A (peptidoglycan hydrolase)
VIRPGANAPLPTSGQRVSETGLAELIDDSQGSAKYLALHRTAPVGTLVLVRNDENNQSIWVKVIGRLPDTGVNDNVLIKLSARAFAKLGTSDRRFRAEVSYVK